MHPSRGEVGTWLCLLACLLLLRALSCMGCINDVRVGQWVVCMLFSYYVEWSGLVRPSFVWCGQDWYSCALCGVCLYAAQLLHSVVRTGTAVLCVVTVYMLLSYHTVWSGLVQLCFVWCGQDLYGCTLCGVCMLFTYHMVWSGLVQLCFVWCLPLYGLDTRPCRGMDTCV